MLLPADPPAASGADPPGTAGLLAGGVFQASQRSQMLLPSSGVGASAASLTRSALGSRSGRLQMTSTLRSGALAQSLGQSGPAPHAQSAPGRFQDSGQDLAVSRGKSGAPGDEEPQEARPITSPQYWRMYYMLPLLHFVVGVSNCLPGVSLNQYYIHGVDIAVAQQTLLGSVINSLPWNLKIFAAFLSDVAPICGKRRVPYLIIGSFTQGLAWLVLGIFGNSLSFPALCLQSFFGTMGQMLIGVMCDTLIVENMKFEVESGGEVGMLMTNTQLWYAIGGLTGQLLSGFMPQTLGISYLWMFNITAMCKFSVTTMAFVMSDPRYVSGQSAGERFKHTWGGIWSTMKLVRVFCPLIFIIVFACAPQSTQAFNTYLLQVNPICKWTASDTPMCATQVMSTDKPPEPLSDGIDYCNAHDGSEHDCDTTWGGLEFSDISFSLIGTLSSIGCVLGNLIFQRFFLNAGWHKLFLSIVLIATASSLLTLLLMFRDPETGLTINEKAHIPNVFFALGDDVIVATTSQLLAMPILILMAKLCPAGAEGTTYALVTSIQCVGGTVSGIISKILVSAFGVTNVNFGHLWQLTLITGCGKMLCIPFLPLVPKSVGEGSGDDRRHLWCGVFLVGCFVGGLSWAIVQIIMSLVNTQ